MAWFGEANSYIFYQSSALFLYGLCSNNSDNSKSGVMLVCGRESSFIILSLGSTVLVMVAL